MKDFHLIGTCFLRFVQRLEAEVQDWEVEEEVPLGEVDWAAMREASRGCRLSRHELVSLDPLR